MSSSSYDYFFSLYNFLFGEKQFLSQCQKLQKFAKKAQGILGVNVIFWDEILIKIRLKIQILSKRN
jgi:hypothetical protein